MIFFFPSEAIFYPPRITLRIHRTRRKVQNINQSLVFPTEYTKFQTNSAKFCKTFIGNFENFHKLLNLNRNFCNTIMLDLFAIYYINFLCCNNFSITFFTFDSIWSCVKCVIEKYVCLHYSDNVINIVTILPSSTRLRNKRTVRI